MTIKPVHIVLSIAALVVLVPAGVQAITILNQESENSIRENCVDAQQSMQVLQRTDVVTRISRGNSYATLQKLMTAMSARAAANAYSIPGMTESVGEFAQLKTSFVDQYTEYEINLRNLATMNCQSEPILFYDRLETVREQRQELSETIADIEQQIERFDEAVQGLKIEVQERRDDRQS